MIIAAIRLILTNQKHIFIFLLHKLSINSFINNKPAMVEILFRIRINSA